MSEFVNDISVTHKENGKRCKRERARVGKVGLEVDMPGTRRVVHEVKKLNH